MKWSKATYTNKTICDCDFPVLEDDVPIGTTYNVIRQPEYPGIFICGGCKKQQSVKFIEAQTRDGLTTGLLPLKIFTFGGRAVN